MNILKYFFTCFLILTQADAACGQGIKQNYILSGSCKSSAGHERKIGYWATFSYRIIRMGDSILTLDYRDSTSPEQGQLNITYNDKSCYTLDFSIKGKDRINFLSDDYLRYVHFDSAAADNSHMVAGLTSNQRCSLSGLHSILEILATGGAGSKKIDANSIDDMVRSGDNVKVFDNPFQSIVKIERSNQKIISLSVSDILEDSKATFQPPIDSLHQDFKVNVEILIKVSNQKFSTLFDKRKTIISETEVSKAYYDVLNKISKKTILLSAKESQINKSWDGRDFTETTNPQAEHFASLQKMSNAEKRNQYLWFIGIGVSIVIIGGYAIWKYRRRSAVSLAVVTCLLVSNHANAQSEGPYCGLYCAIAAAAVHEKNLTMEQIRKKEFLSGSTGSTTNDLLRALSVVDLHGQEQRFVTLSSLRTATDPVILHARTPATGQFQHWILFLGFTDYDRVAIYDPPNHRSEISLAELLAVWDGYGITVSKQPTAMSFSIPYDWLLMTAVVVVVYFLIRKYVSAFKTIALLSIMGGVACGLSPHGLLRKPQATGIISARYFPQLNRELTFEEFQNARNEGQSVYVDARPSDSYNAFKIPESINIPVNAGLLQLHEITASYSRDQPMICFCLSKTCGWADAVANQLHHLGFRNVSIYRGGVADWMQHKQPIEK